MPSGIPIQPTTVAFRLPDHLRQSDQESAFSRARGGVALDSFLEGPAFDREGHLWCVDLAHGRIFRISPDGDWRLFAQYEGRPNGLKIGPSGEIVVADVDQGILAFDPATGSRRIVVDRWDDQPLAGPNDLTFAPNGDLYFTDPGTSDWSRPHGRVFRRSPDGEMTLMLQGLAYPNGLALTPSGDALLVAVTRTLQVLRMTLHPDHLSRQRVGVFLQLSGGLTGPDGIAIRPNGDVLVAHSGLGTIWYFDRLGELVARYRSVTGIRTTNVAFTPDGRGFVVTESETGTILKADFPPTYT